MQWTLLQCLGCISIFVKASERKFVQYLYFQQALSSTCTAPPRISDLSSVAGSEGNTHSAAAREPIQKGPEQGTLKGEDFSRQRQPLSFACSLSKVATDYDDGSSDASC